MGRKRSTRRKQPTTIFRKCHMLKPEHSICSRDSDLHPSFGWQAIARIADTLTITKAFPQNVFSQIL